MSTTWREGCENAAPPTPREGRGTHLLGLELPSGVEGAPASKLRRSESSWLLLYSLPFFIRLKKVF